MPTLSSLRTSAQMLARISFDWRRWGGEGFLQFGSDWVGCGQRFAVELAVGVSGRESRNTKAEGTM